SKGRTPWRRGPGSEHRAVTHARLPGNVPEELFERVRGQLADRCQPVRVHLLQTVLHGVERHRPAGPAGVLLAEEDGGDRSAATPGGSVEDVVVAPLQEAAHLHPRAVADPLDPLAQALRAANAHSQPAAACADA